MMPVMPDLQVSSPDIYRFTTKGEGTATLKHQLLMDKILPTSSFVVGLPYLSHIQTKSLKVHRSHLLSPHSCGHINTLYSPFLWIPSKPLQFPPINPQKSSPSLFWEAANSTTSPMPIFIVSSNQRIPIH